MSIILDYDREETYPLTIKCKYKDDFGYVIFIGDIHLGHKDCSMSFLTRTIRMVKRLAKRHAVAVILLGDLIETDKDYSPQFIIENVSVRTREQFAQILQTLDPIKNLCKFAVWGNHEERLIRDTKTKRALEMIGIDNFYDVILKKLNPEIIVAQPQRGLNVNLRVGRQKYSIRIAHGAYGGYAHPELQHKRESNNFPTASLIAMGHHHQKYWKDKVKIVNIGNRRAIILQNWVGTGTFLRYASYAERKSYPINIIGCPIIKAYSSVQHLEYVNSPEFHARFLKASGGLPMPSIQPFRALVSPLINQRGESKNKLLSTLTPQKSLKIKIKRKTETLGGIK